jgi:GDP-4-dehydro-6-deoxy-D-mannose reductase
VHRRVLITGSTGFAGSHLVEYYARRGWAVHGTHRTPVIDGGWLPPGVTLHQIDLCDRRAVVDLVTRIRPNVICHLAARSSVSASLDDPVGTIADNTAAQHAVLEAALAADNEIRVLVVGSADEYGPIGPDQNPVDEDHPLLPRTPYAISKVVQDLMGQAYSVTDELQVVRVRPFLQLGPRRSDRFVAGSFARQIAEIALGLRDPVLRVGNINLERDFTDVRDVVRAYALAAEEGVPGQVYNVASGRAVTLRHMLQVMLDAANVEAELRVDQAIARPGEPLRLIGTAARLTAQTGWSPTISFEQSAVDTLVHWQQRIGQTARFTQDQ